MTFMESLMGEVDFLIYLHDSKTLTMANVITEMIALGGASPEWGDRHSMPEDVFARCTAVADPTLFLSQ